MTAQQRKKYLQLMSDTLTDYLAWCYRLNNYIEEPRTRGVFEGIDFDRQVQTAKEVEPTLEGFADWLEQAEEAKEEVELSKKSKAFKPKGVGYDMDYFAAHIADLIDGNEVDKRFHEYFSVYKMTTVNGIETLYVIGNNNEYCEITIKQVKS